MQMVPVRPAANSSTPTPTKQVSAVLRQTLCNYCVEAGKWSDASNYFWSSRNKLINSVALTARLLLFPLPLLFSPYAAPACYYYIRVSVLFSVKNRTGNATAWPRLNFTDGACSWRRRWGRGSRWEEDRDPSETVWWRWRPLGAA